MSGAREPVTRQEHVAKAIHDKHCQFSDWQFIHSGRAQDMDVAQWALDAAEEWDIANPGNIPKSYWDIITAPRPAPEERSPRPPRTAPLTRPESLDDDDYRWAEDQDRWAAEFSREELEWIAAAANDAIRAQDEAAADAKRKAEEDARWDARRAELIEQFNGGPIKIGTGQPIPTMALKAVEYIIETERNAEKGNA